MFSDYSKKKFSGEAYVELLKGLGASKSENKNVRTKATAGGSLFGPNVVLTVARGHSRE